MSISSQDNSQQPRLMLCITKQIITFSIKKIYNSQKSYYIGDWTVQMLQLHRLPLLTVTGQEPHNKEKGKYPICQALNGWGTGKRKEKKKREVQLPMTTAAPRLQISGPGCFGCQSGISS